MKKFFQFSLLISGLLVCLHIDARIRAHIEHELLEPYTHGEHFEWVTGELKYLGVEGPTWDIIYNKEHNKKFLLLTGKEYVFQPPEGFKDGDIVVLTGQVGHLEMSSFMTGDYYSVEKIELLDVHNQQVKQEQEQAQSKS
jgi:hypothetical protein